MCRKSVFQPIFFPVFQLAAAERRAKIAPIFLDLRQPQVRYSILGSATVPLQVFFVQTCGCRKSENWGEKKSTLEFGLDPIILSQDKFLRLGLDKSIKFKVDKPFNFEINS